MYNGYDFYMAGMKLPIAPSSLEINIASKNETVDLINEGEINILKAPSLIEISFQARFPMRNYPYAPQVDSFQTYFDIIKGLKEKKTPFDFIVARAKPNGELTWDTNLKVALESFNIKEDWEQGDDVLIDFTLKQYKAYGTKTVKVTNENQVQKPPSESRTEKPVTQTNYTIKSGDTLWGIAKRHFGNGARWPEIYNINQAVIEEAARAHGKQSSSNGHWIWAGTQIVLPSA